MLRNHSWVFAPDKDSGSGSADGDSQTDTSVNESTEESTDSTSSQSSGNQSKETVDWKSKYQGMTKEYDRYKKQTEGEIAALKAKLVEKDTELGLRTSEKVDFETKHTTASKENELLKSTLATKSTEAESASKQLARMKLIAKDFPMLVKFEANDLLPQADNDEDLKVKLSAFQSSIKDIAGEKANDLLAGSSISGGESSNTSNDSYDEDSLWTQISQLASTGLRTPEQQTKYNDLMKKWDVIQSKKK
jgi:hypothetical protein